MSSRGLRQAQAVFALSVAELLNMANTEGRTVTLGDAYRDPRWAGEWGKPGTGPRRWAPYGAKDSYHKLRLAIDLNLFSARGRYLTSTAAHRDIGEWWESLGQQLGEPLRWGGRWGDGNHYELAYHDRDRSSWPGGSEFFEGD